MSYCPFLCSRPSTECSVLYHCHSGIRPDGCFLAESRIRDNLCCSLLLECKNIKSLQHAYMKSCSDPSVTLWWKDILAVTALLKAKFYLVKQPSSAQPMDYSARERDGAGDYLTQVTVLLWQGKNILSREKCPRAACFLLYCKIILPRDHFHQYAAVIFVSWKTKLKM